MVQEFRPDVITLDIEMPKVDGLRFLEVMMKAMPTPVVMISTLTERGADAVGVLLTGMGRDGAQGLKNMHTNGSVTFCQDEKTCVIYGMPKIAVELKAASVVKPLENISDAILDTLEALGASFRL